MVFSISCTFEMICRILFIFVLVVSLNFDDVGIYAILTAAILVVMLVCRLFAEAFEAILTRAKTKGHDDIDPVGGYPCATTSLLTLVLIIVLVLSPMMIASVEIVQAAKLEISLGSLLCAAILANFIKKIENFIDQRSQIDDSHLEIIGMLITISTIGIVDKSLGPLTIFVAEIVGTITIVCTKIVVINRNQRYFILHRLYNQNKFMNFQIMDVMEYINCIILSFICYVYISYESREINIIGIVFIGSQLVLAFWRFAVAHEIQHPTPGNQQQKNSSEYDQRVHDRFSRSHRRVSTAAMACLFLSSPLISHVLFGELRTTFVGFAWLFCVAYWLLLLSVPGWFFLQAHRSLRDPLELANRTLLACGLLMTGGLLVEGALGAALGLLGGATFGALSIAAQSYRQKLREYGPQERGGEVDGVVFSTILVVMLGTILTPVASGGVVAAAVLASLSIIVVLLVLS